MKQQKKGVITSNDLQKIKEIIEKEYPHVKIEWIYKKENER